jgi:hypothetical protein
MAKNEAELAPQEGEGKKGVGPFAPMAPVRPDEPAFNIGSATSTAPSSLTAGFKMAKQASKGTPMTTGFTIGRVVESAVQSAYDYTNNAEEHFNSSQVRATVRKSAARRVSYLASFGFRSYLHPELIGLALLGLGYTSTVAGTTEKTHTFTIANRNASPWLTVINRVGEGAAILERRLTDCRLQGLTLDGNVAGLVVAGSGFGIKEGLAVGTETGTVEPETQILPCNGSLTTLTVNGEQLDSSVRQVRLQLANQLDTSEVALWSYERSDLAQAGVDFAGVMRGIDVTPDVYKMLNYGSLAGTGPNTVCPEGAIKFKFAAPGTIPGSSLPYSIEFDIPKVEWRMAPIQARGSDMIRLDLAFMMIDDGVNPPATIKLVNEKATY